MKKQIERHRHKDCIHCTAYKGGFLSTEGNPVLGRCEYDAEKMYILDELTECRMFKKKY